MLKINDYKIIEKIGQGGMATVYKAKQISLDRLVAIKVLSMRLVEKRELVERFNREAIIIAKLTHPNIIHIIDRGITDGKHYFVMDYVEGSDFAHIVKDGGYNAKQKVEVIVQVAKALSYAHKNGVIHRDIKPANILIDKEGNAMVSDFGIARLFEEHNEGEEELTTAGAIMGTLAYMSPEQKVDSGKVTYATDIYSLGVIMYEMFTGVKPLGRFKLPSEINPKFPKPLEKIMLNCLETDSANRFKSADELKDRLLALLKGAHIKKNKKAQVFQGIKRIEDKFVLLDIIKEHKYGAVYLFEKKEDKKLIVIKKSKNQKGGFTESKLLTSLSHDNIVRIFGVSGDKKLFIIVMEYINGGSLRDRMVKTYKWPEALKIVREVCKGLAFAHKNRIIHGNLRPGNILITQKGEIKITDFGLDEHYAEVENHANWYHPKDESRSFAADIFSAGVILYEMLTGSIPDRREGELVSNDRFGSLPSRVQRVILGMISLDSKKRSGTFDVVIDGINTIMKSKKRKKKRFSLTFLLMLLFLSISAYCLWFYKEDCYNYINMFIELWNRLTLNG